MREKRRRYAKFALSNEFPFGLSNEVVADFAKITVHSGAALVIIVREKR